MRDNYKKRISTACTVGICTAIIVVSAYIRIPMIVPITLQSLAIMLVSGVFGAKIGLLSTAAYILLGAIGLPIFSGAEAGASALFGISGGFIWGFLLVSAFVGIITDIFCKRGKNSFVLRLIVMLVAGVVLYACGVAFYCLAYVGAADSSVGAAMSLLVLPYIIPDIVKMVLAAYLSYRLVNLKQKNFGGES